MCFVNVLAGRSAQSLHAVVAGAKEERADDVDDKMDPDPDFVDAGAIS